VRSQQGEAHPFWLSPYSASPLALILPPRATKSSGLRPSYLSQIKVEYAFEPNRLTFRSGIAYRQHVENHGQPTVTDFSTDRGTLRC